MGGVFGVFCGVTVINTGVLMALFDGYAPYGEVINNGVSGLLIMALLFHLGMVVVSDKALKRDSNPTIVTDYYMEVGLIDKLLKEISVK